MASHKLWYCVLTSSLPWSLQDAAKKAELRMGVYVRVHGHLRVFDGQKSVVAFNMRPITDFNEVSRCHACWVGADKEGICICNICFWSAYTCVDAQDPGGQKACALQN